MPAPKLTPSQIHSASRAEVEAQVRKDAKGLDPAKIAGDRGPRPEVWPERVRGHPLALPRHPEELSPPAHEIAHPDRRGEPFARRLGPGRRAEGVDQGPDEGLAEATIVLDARASVADRPLRWKLDGPDVPFVTLDQDGRRGVVAIVPAAPAGVYKFTLIARGIPAGDTELDADAAIWVVVVKAPAPPAPPTPTPTPVPPSPGPGPTPPPPPVSGPLHVSLVLDLDAMTPDLAALREGIKRARGV